MSEKKRQCSLCKELKPHTEEYFPVDKKRGKKYLRTTCTPCRLGADKKRITTPPYVYIFKDLEGSIVYVGKTKQLKRRIHRHFTEKPLPWKQEFKGTIEVAEMDNTADMNIMEMYLIAVYQPIHNKRDNFGEQTTFTLPIPTFTFYMEI